MDRKIELRVERIKGHLNDLLRDSFPDKEGKYQIVAQEVDEYVLGQMGSEPIKVILRDVPTYEFDLTPKDNPEPRFRVMILHGPDLRKKVRVEKERDYFQIRYFEDNILNGIEKLESMSKN